MAVSENSGTPKSSILIGFFQYNPSILGYPYFRKHSYSINSIFSIQWLAKVFFRSRNTLGNTEVSANSSFANLFLVQSLSKRGSSVHALERLTSTMFFSHKSHHLAFWFLFHLPMSPGQRAKIASKVFLHPSNFPRILRVQLWNHEIIRFFANFPVILWSEMIL